MNTAAVKFWEQRQSSNLYSTSNKPKRNRRRRRRPGADRGCTPSDIAVKTPRPQPQHISETPSHKTTSSGSPNHHRNTPRILEQIPSHSIFHPHNITVQISQHSSFDRDLYAAYQSSISTQGKSSSLLLHQNPGLGESSLPEASLPRTGDSNGVIPDSQSSSSYRPTSSVSSEVLGADQAPLTTQPRVLHTSTDLWSSTGRVAEANESVEDSSAIAVAASQPSVVASERSRSEPAPNIAASSSESPFRDRFPSLPRSTSGPTFTSHNQSRRRTLVSEYPSDHRIIYDEVIQSSADFHSPHQTETGRTRQRQRSSELQVPGSADRISHQSHVVDVSPTDSLVFQTQVPLAFANQGSRVSITLAGISSGGLSRNFT